MKSAKFLVLAVALGLAAGASATDRAPQDAKAKSLERGRYLIATAGCNDCHTAGFIPSAGKVPEKEWLKGDAVGYRGPWGTTYPSNLRLVLAPMTEAQWLARARSEMRPPMPWFNLRDMSDADVIAIYRYLRHLGPAGERGPAALPPGQEPPLPYVAWVLPKR